MTVHSDGRTMWWLLIAERTGADDAVWAIVVTNDPAGWTSRAAHTGADVYCVAIPVAAEALTREDHTVVAGLPRDRLLMHPDTALPDAHALSVIELDFVGRLVETAADWMALHGPRAG